MKLTGEITKIEKRGSAALAIEGNFVAETDGEYESYRIVTLQIPLTAAICAAYYVGRAIQVNVTPL